MLKKTRGGLRSNSGRKPAVDPKEPITFYLERSKIKANGGIDKCKSLSYSFLFKRGEKNNFNEK